MRTGSRLKKPLRSSRSGESASRDTRDAAGFGRAARRRHVRVRLGPAVARHALPGPGILDRGRGYAGPVAATMPPRRSRSQSVQPRRQQQLAIPARARNTVEDSGVVVRVVAAPRVSQRPAQTRGWLSRVMQGLSQLREPVESRPRRLRLKVVGRQIQLACGTRPSSGCVAPGPVQSRSGERPDAPGSAAAVAPFGRHPDPLAACSTGSRTASLV